MGKVNQNREEPSRRPKQGGAPDPRRQIEGAKRRPAQAGQPQQPPKRRPNGETQQSVKHPRQEGTTADSRRQEAAPRREQAPQQPKPRKAPQQGAPAGKQRKASTAPSKPSQQPQKAASRRVQPDDLSSKKRAYGNSKPKKPSAFSVLSKAISATAKENGDKRRARLERQGKRSRHDSKQPLPAVIYTQPQAFNRDRLLVQLVTVTAVVAAFVVGLSVFFKVEHIRVSGAEVYTAWTVEEASGIKEGDNLLTFSRARAGALIKANLPYVKNVSFGIKLPDTVNIIIEEEDVVYAIKDQDEQWWLMNSEGRVVEQAKKGQASNYTQILGVALDHPLKDQKAVAVEAMTVTQDPNADPTAETTEVVAVPTVSGAQRLEIAMQIVQALEDNDIVGDAASINVSHTQAISLWYGTRYQVNFGDRTNLEYKVACMNSVIMEMQDYQSGILDLSFTVWPDQVVYTPFS